MDSGDYIILFKHFPNNFFKNKGYLFWSLFTITEQKFFIYAKVGTIDKQSYTQS